MGVRGRGGKRALIGSIAVVATLLVSFASGPGRAEAAVYWGTTYAIGAANLDGSSPQQKYFKPPFPADFSAPACGVAVTPTYLYWAGAFGLGRVNLEGPATPAGIGPPLEAPCGIAVDSAHVYWGNSRAGSIGRENLDGSEANADFIPGVERPCAVAADASHLYWVGNWGSVGRANLDGSEAQLHFLTSSEAACGIAVDGNYIYWGHTASIARARLDGGEYQPAFITGVHHVSAIAVDGAHVYWVDSPEGAVFSSIGRANLDGSGVEPEWIHTESFNLGGVAVDARPSPPPLPLPSRPFYLGHLVHNLHTGAVVLAAFVPERGDLSVAAPGIRWQLLEGPEPPPYRGGSFTWHLKVWPGAKGTAGWRIRRQLKLRGRAPLTLRVSYNEEGHLPVTDVKRVVLLKLRQPNRR